MAFNIQFSASLIVRKLASYPRQNRLALVICELGGLERTLFILEWIKSPSLRGKVQDLIKGFCRIHVDPFYTDSRANLSK